jgi:hypothetical protein
MTKPFREFRVFRSGDLLGIIPDKEWRSLRLQNATLKRGQHRKYMPYAFTEHGAIMAATVLNSSQAVQMSVAVVRGNPGTVSVLALGKIITRSREVAKGGS